MTDTSVTQGIAPAEVAGRSLTELALMRFKRNKAAMAGCVMLALIVLFSFLPPPGNIYQWQESWRLGGIERQWVSWKDISPDMARSAVAAEDANFCYHHGIDFEAVKAAAQANYQGRKLRGGSTISQQLAKNLFLSNQRTPWRKAEETIITLMLETILSKQRILEIYLNVIEWGNNVYGIEAASLRYFSSHAKDLNSFQSAKLASMIPNPKYYERHQDASGLIERSGIILSRMNKIQVP